ncbi:AAA family ATPase [Roseivirga sp. UBA838]|uniref:AAA family ATPase n=1 Tax=Roseivirga sp. UBA838 TaxID=1947393 RepID=UPI00257972B4|nr:AAA family ATPase [Roseivirga sp. UBA838]|tara:strand:+ start:9768 stop:10676 length:909 start_codon:yes stop_codon:yes gene_type:complete
MELRIEIKDRIVETALSHREQFTGSDSSFAKTLGINQAVFNRLKNGEREGLLKDSKWLELAEKYDISLTKKQWNIVKTDVFKTILEDVQNCQRLGISLMFADECEIGKTTTLKWISRNVKNAIYVDCSQARTKTKFLRTFAQAVGVDPQGKISELASLIKRQLCLLSASHSVVVLLDEAGDIDTNTRIECKGIWNYCDEMGHVGWYAAGADSLEHNISRGIANKKLGMREWFSRFGSRYNKIVPPGKEEKELFYKKLISDVLKGNIQNKDQIGTWTNKAIKSDLVNHYGGLRRAKYTVLLNQ